MQMKIFFMERISKMVQKIRKYKYKLQGYSNISDSAILESNLLLDKVYPAGIHIGDNTLIAAGTTILTHEHVKRDRKNPKLPYMVDTFIGSNCFIGINAMIMPGVKIGNEVIVGAGTIVTKNIPSNSIIVGSPSRILDKKVNLTNRAVLTEYNY